MGRFFLMAFIVVSGACCAWAQLGQPQSATDTFLGRPLASHVEASTNTTVVRYRNAAYEVTAGFKNNGAAYFIYKKSTGGSWQDAEIQAVLDAHRLGHSEWKWDKNIITGRHGPAVHRGAPSHINEAQHWHIFAHDQYAAEYYPEKGVLIVWDTAQGVEPAAILNQAPL